MTVVIIPKELKRLSVLVVKINPTCVVSLMQNVLFFTTIWPANAVQNRSRRFCEVRITISCNSRLVSANFSCLILVSFINSFGISRIVTTCFSFYEYLSLIHVLGILQNRYHLLRKNKLTIIQCLLIKTLWVHSLI